ncbi:MAG: OmpA family protein [Bacteroidota bacterium]
MVKYWYLAFALLISTQVGWSQQVLIDTVFFDFDSDYLKPSHMDQLDSMSSKFLSYPTYYVEIYGHTDSIGSTGYNLELSEMRARKVALYLIEKGTLADRIFYEGLGTNKPIGPNTTYAGRKKNRRADISVIYTREIFSPPVVEDTTATDTVAETPVVVEDPASLVDTVYCSYAPFEIDTKKKTVIIAPQGTQITVPAGAFKGDTEYIEIKVSELYTRRDMIVAAMPSVEKKKGPYEATGMFTFEARDGRRLAQIADDKSFEVLLPATRRDPYTRVYSGSGGTRGRSRSRGGNTAKVKKPAMTAVKAWNEENYPIRYLGPRKAYTFEINKSGKFAVGRPLHYSQNTEKDDLGTNFIIKLKGKRFEKTTQVMLVGEVVKTYIPLKKVSKKVYEGDRVKFLDNDTELVLIGIQYDDKGEPYLAKISFKPGTFLGNKKRDPKKRPTIKLKAKFRKITPERLEELLTELNV